MTEPTTSTAFTRKPNPFANMKISDNAFLSTVEGRQPCAKCHKSRKFFCYTCYIPLENIGTFPHVKLPVKIDIIKHRSEIDGKSTAAHAAILAPHDVTVYEYPNIPNYDDEEGVVLIFPSQTCTDVRSLFTGIQQFDMSHDYNRHRTGTLLRYKLKDISLEDGGRDSVNSHCSSSTGDCRNKDHQYDLTNLPIKRAIFIDSTWNQSRGIYKDERIGSLKCVVLQNRLSQFWRHQKGSPRWYLSTVEAIHQFLLEVHMNAWGIDPRYSGLEHLEISAELIASHTVSGYERQLDAKTGGDNDDDDDGDETNPYNGQYDNLLFFFTHMYGLIHTYYDHNKLKAYKRPIN